MRLLFFLLPFILMVPLFASIRESAVAGMWYDSDPDALRKTIQGYLAGAGEVTVPGRLRALVVPHAGYTYSGPTAGYAFKALEGRQFSRVILIGTSHYSGHRGISIGDFDAYRTPLGKLPVDKKMVKELLKNKHFSYIPEAHRREHSLEAQLPFLQLLQPEASIVTLLPGHATTIEDDREIARVLIPYLDDNTVVIVSTDFTHYGHRFQYQPFRKDVKKRLKELDLGAWNLLSKGDPLDFQLYLDTTRASVCGQRALRLLLSLFPGAEHTLLHYTTSGEVSGDFENSVSYIASAVSQEKRVSLEDRKRKPLSGQLTEKERKDLLELARASLHSHLFGSGRLSDALKDLDRSGHLGEIAGAFVTLNKEGKLRGCIGYIEGVSPLYQAVVDNAVSAASRDHRFSPVSGEEFEKIEIEVSVLSPLREISSYKEIKLGVHGVILKKHGRRSVYLPQVATETGWTLEQFLSRLSQKAGLEKDAWREGAVFDTFTAEVFHE